MLDTFAQEDDMHYIKMPRELRDKWLAALRSGKYEQGIGCMKTQENKYCCLGVLQMAVDGHVETWEGLFKDPVSESLPTREWLEKHGIQFATSNGTPSRQPWLPTLRLAAAHANDSGAFDFNAIADAIEATCEIIE